MLDSFRRNLLEGGLIPEGSRVLVGYSGGADSTCLIHLLHSCGVDIIGAHLHHGQRPEAQNELELCQAFCDELGIPFVGGHADVPRLSKDLKIGLEEAGRHARYSFFKQAAAQAECDLIATAHTQNDTVETVLLNIVRGCGISGLAGIPERRDNIVRPILRFSREQTRGYCVQHGFWYHDDPSNEDLSFARARVRHRIIPEFRAINPAAHAAITRLSEIASEEDKFLNGMAAAALEQSEQLQNGDLHFLTADCEMTFKRDVLCTLPPVLFSRAVRLAAEVLGAWPSRDQTGTVLTGVATEEKGSVTAEGGSVVIEWTAEELTVRQLTPTAPFRYPITLPGQTSSDEFGWEFTAFEAKIAPKEQARASFEVFLDRAKVKGQLYFRSFAKGDEMKPMGFGHKRKLSDILSEAKLTSAARGRLPIVCDLVGPLWAPGVCLDERALPDATTSAVIVLRFAALRA